MDLRGRHRVDEERPVHPRKCYAARLADLVADRKVRSPEGMLENMTEGMVEGIARDMTASASSRTLFMSRIAACCGWSGPMAAWDKMISVFPCVKRGPIQRASVNG